MKILQFILINCLALFTHAQYTISGNLTPAEEFKWVILYELTPGGTQYITDTEVSEGNFNLKMPVTAQPGIYRFVYAVPQDEYYIDFIYSKNEDIDFSFNIENGISYNTSKENLIYEQYLSEIMFLETKLSHVYNQEKNQSEAYKKIRKDIIETQFKFESLLQNSIAQILIKANRTHLPEKFESYKTYTEDIQAHFFDNLDINNKILQASNHFTDKLSSFAFLSLASNKNSNTLTKIKTDIKTVNQKINTTSLSFQVKVLHNIWSLANSNNLKEVAIYVFEEFLKEKALKNNNQQIVDSIEIETRLGIGSISPEITWNVNGVTKKLSNQQGYDKYVLIFWSSTCSHCLKELPSLHESLKNIKNIKIIAVGLEDDLDHWKKTSASLPIFSHAIALGKWQSDYAHTFDVHQTPSYFILDKDKRFISKPEESEDVITFLKNM